MLFTYTTYCLHILYTSSSQAWKIFERNLQRVPSSSGRRRRRSVCDSFRDGAASWRPAFVQASACSKDKRGGPTPQVVWRQQLGERHRHAFPSFSSQRSQVMPERLLVARTRSARTRLLRRQFGDKRTCCMAARHCFLYMRQAGVKAPEIRASRLRKSRGFSVWPCRSRERASEDRSRGGGDGRASGRERRSMALVWRRGWRPKTALRRVKS